MPRAFKPRSTRTFRRSVLVFKMEVAGITVFPCSHCSSRDLPCIASQDSIKCSECVRSDVSCDLIMSVEDWKKLLAERKRVRSRVAECLKQASDLQASIALLDDEIAAVLQRET